MVQMSLFSGFVPALRLVVNELQIPPDWATREEWYRRGYRVEVEDDESPVAWLCSGGARVALWDYLQVDPVQDLQAFQRRARWENEYFEMVG